MAFCGHNEILLKIIWENYPNKFEFKQMKIIHGNKNKENSSIKKRKWKCEENRKQNAARQFWISCNEKIQNNGNCKQNHGG